MRRSFLCGFDKFSEKTYDHRRDWNEARIRTLAGIFAIDVCAYAVLSNHYHVVLHIDKPKSLAWTDVEVSERWHQLFNGTALTQKYVKGEPLSRAEHLAVKMKLGQWRLQLLRIFANCEHQILPSVNTYFYPL